jgi:hypothetical protein
MSLKMALLQGDDIEVNNNILTISDINNNFELSVLYSCFIKDIDLNHPTLGKGRIIDFKDQKWVCDFEHSTQLQELKTKTIINYLN